jgi:hypothetical protein
MAINWGLEKILLAAALLSETDARLEAGITSTEPVHVCMERAAEIQLAVDRAQSIASGMFEAIGITIEWHGDRRPFACALLNDQAILVTLRMRTHELDHPGALAYALPYEGKHVYIFSDRVLKAAPGRVPFLLAHVLAHEITHVLQGTNQHSASGVMKARWDTEDYVEMERKPLSFTEIDVMLIQRGLDARKLRLARSRY